MVVTLGAVDARSGYRAYEARSAPFSALFVSSSSFVFLYFGGSYLTPFWVLPYLM